MADDAGAREAAAVGGGALFVVVSGRPGSGKSTLAAQLAPTLGLSLLAKDAIKHALVDVLGAADVHASRELGRAARRVLLTVAATSAGAVLDSVWPPDDDVASGPAGVLWALPGTVVEVHCDVSAELAAQRCRARHAGRGDVDERFAQERTEEEQARAGLVVAGGWPVLSVDTAGDADVRALADRIRSVARR